MLSRENKVIAVFVAVAMVLTYGGYWLTDAPSELLMGVLFFVGVVVPMVINNHLDHRASA